LLFYAQISGQKKGVSKCFLFEAALPIYCC